MTILGKRVATYIHTYICTYPYNKDVYALLWFVTHIIILDFNKELSASTTLS